MANTICKPEARNQQASALLVIDVQQAFFDRSEPPFDSVNTLQNINLLIAKAREAGSAIIFVQHQVAGALEPGSAGWQVDQRLDIRAEDLRVDKTTPDSFLATDLAQKLDSLAVGKLIICGFASEFCVDTTTRRAAGLGFDCQLVRAAHTTFDKSHASGEWIRQHQHNTLTSIASYPLPIRDVDIASVAF